MFHDIVITIAGRTIVLTSHDLVTIAFSLFSGLLFWGLLYFSRKRVVVFKKSPAMDQLLVELSRIADAAERIAGLPADRVNSSAFRAAEPASPVGKHGGNGSRYSMFDRL